MPSGYESGAKKTIDISIKAEKMTADVLKSALREFMSGKAEKKGRMTYKKLQAKSPSKPARPAAPPSCAHSSIFTPPSPPFSAWHPSRFCARLLSILCLLPVFAPLHFPPPTPLGFAPAQLPFRIHPPRFA